MSNASLVITIKTNRSVADLARFIKDTSEPRDECLRLEHFFQRAKGGTESINFDVQTSANAPVKAHQTLTLTYASITDQDTCVIGGTTLTAVTGTSDGLTQFKKVTNLATTLANLAATINANTTLNKLVSAAVTSTGVVTLTALCPGVVGNQITLVGSTGIVAGAANFASGAGAHETVAVNYTRGL